MHSRGMGVGTSRHGMAVSAALLWIIGGAITAQADPPREYDLANLKALQRAFVDLAEQVRPSVVAIRTYKVRNAGTASRYVMRPFSQGSGFIMDAEGHVVTNRHVVEGAEVISVILHDGFKHDATVVQVDPRSDLAVLKIDAKNLQPVRFSDHAELEVNQWVFACGNPFGMANDTGNISVTYGVVSALGRHMTHRLVGDSDVEYYGNMIETSATINPGNSGGPLFNIDGDVVGVVAAIETSTGVSDGHGFAIPIDKNTRRILDLLVAGREVRYGFLGVLVQDAEPTRSSLVADSHRSRGAEVREISLAAGPADRAGLKARDIITEFDGVAIQDSDHLVRLVGFTPVGTKVSLTYLRSGIKRKTSVTVGDRAVLLGRADKLD